MDKENLTDIINLSGPPTTDLKYTVNQVFNLHDPLDTVPLSKIEVENVFTTKRKNYSTINTKILKFRPYNLNHDTNTKQSQQKLIQRY